MFIILTILHSFWYLFFVNEELHLRQLYHFLYSQILYIFIHKSDNYDYFAQFSVFFPFPFAKVMFNILTILNRFQYLFFVNEQLLLRLLLMNSYYQDNFIMFCSPRFIKYLDARVILEILTILHSFRYLFFINE